MEIVKLNPENFTGTTTEKESSLILYNDDFNTFCFVIDCLVNYLHHDPVQAEQCALIAHYNGKCQVKQGPFDTLKPLCEALIENHLTAEIV